MATPEERALWFPAWARTVKQTLWYVYVDGKLQAAYPTERAADSYVAVFCLNRKASVIRREVTYYAGKP